MSPSIAIISPWLRRRRRRLGLQPTGHGQRPHPPGAGLSDRCRAEHQLQPRCARHRQEGSRGDIPHPLPRRPLCRADQPVAMRPAAAVFRHAAGARLGDAEILFLLSIAESEFSRYFDIRDLEEGAWNDVMGLEVRPTVSPHPVETTIFHFRVLWEVVIDLQPSRRHRLFRRDRRHDQRRPITARGQRRACTGDQGRLPGAGRSEENRHRRRHDPWQRRGLRRRSLHPAAARAYRARPDRRRTTHRLGGAVWHRGRDDSRRTELPVARRQRIPQELLPGGADGTAAYAAQQPDFLTFNPETIITPAGRIPGETSPSSARSRC